MNQLLLPCYTLITPSRFLHLLQAFGISKLLVAPEETNIEGLAYYIPEP